MQTKLTYVAPQVRAYGSLESLTQGKSSGTNVDATFVVTPGTPLPQFTFT